MHEMMIGTRTCTDELGSLHTFRYWLITQRIPAGRFAFEDYGVKVEETGGENVCLCSLTHSRTRIDTLLDILIEHSVTPVNLPEVVEDWAKENHLPQPRLQQVADVV